MLWGRRGLLILVLLGLLIVLLRLLVVLLRWLLVGLLRRSLLGGLGRVVLLRTLPLLRRGSIALVVVVLVVRRGWALVVSLILRLVLVRRGWALPAAIAATLHRLALLIVRLLRMLGPLILILRMLALLMLILRRLILISTLLRALALLGWGAVALRGPLLILGGVRRTSLRRRGVLALRWALHLRLLRRTLILGLVLVLILVLALHGPRRLRLLRSTLLRLLWRALGGAIHLGLRTLLLLGRGRRRGRGDRRARLRRRSNWRFGPGAGVSRRGFSGSGCGRGRLGGSARGLLGRFVDRGRARDARRALRRLAGRLPSGSFAGAGLWRAGTVGGWTLVALAAGTGGHRKGESCWGWPAGRRAECGD